MSVNETQQGFPNIQAPIANADLSCNQVWLQLFITLWNRTGGGHGASINEALLWAISGEEQPRQEQSGGGGGGSGAGLTIDGLGTSALAGDPLIVPTLLLEPPWIPQLDPLTSELLSVAPASSTAGNTTALTTNHIFVGNGSNVATDVAMSGDATIVASGALTIANTSVTYAKMQNISAASLLLGRGSAGGAGSPQEITLGTNLSMSGTTLNASSTPGGNISPFSDGGITKPVASSFSIADDTTAGHGTGTKADLATRGVEFTNTRNSINTQSWFYVAAISNTLNTINVFVAPNYVDVINLNNSYYGIGVRDNTGKIDSFGLSFSNATGTTEWVRATFTNISTNPTFTVLTGGYMAVGRPIWLKLQKVSTNFVFSVSFNGETYTTVTTVSATSFVGATLNDDGIVLYNAMNTGPGIINLDCFSFTNT